jgi:DNA-binding IclR family transcriptional regulator
MAGNSQIQGQSVASKLVRILDLFTADHPRLRASDVCRRSGLPFSTVHRLLAELAGSGVLRRSPDGTYAVGLRLWQLAASHPQLRSLHASALPAMSALYASVDASVYLNVLVGGEGLCIEEIQRPDDSGFQYGTRFPLRATAGGQVLLAYAEMRSLTGPRPADEDLPSDERLHQIMRIRRAGVAVSTATGRLAVAAPVFGGTGPVIASLEAAAAPCADRVGLACAVRRAAADASARLSAQDRPTRPVGTMSAYPPSGYDLDDRTAS